MIKTGRNAAVGCWILPARLRTHAMREISTLPADIPVDMAKYHCRSWYFCSQIPQMFVFFLPFSLSTFCSLNLCCCPRERQHINTSCRTPITRRVGAQQTHIIAKIRQSHFHHGELTKNTSSLTHLLQISRYQLTMAYNHLPILKLHIHK